MAKASTAEKDDDQQVSLDDAISAAWDAGESVDDADAAPDTEQTDESGQSAEAEAETEGREAETETPEPGGEETEAPEAEPEAEAEAETPEPEQPTVEPPEDWPTEWADAFRRIPTDTGRNAMLTAYKSMQADYTRKNQEIAEVRRAIPDDTRERLRLNGMTEGQYMTQLAAADRYLSTNPREAIQWLAKSYGVDLESFGAGEGDEDVDPRISQLTKQVEDLRSTLQQRDHDAQQSVQQQAVAQVQEFQSEKDENGNLRHPHFDQVRTQMQALIQAGAAEGLQDAYEQAVWAVPSLRSSLLEQQQREQAAKAEADKKAKASRARQAATPASTGTTAAEKEESSDLDTVIARAYDQSMQ